jgi:glucose-6-phosphate isomerase
VVVSKSGGTLESMSAFFLCWEKLKQARKGKAKDGVVAITDPKAGALRTFCLEQGIRTLSIPPNVGGRYCIFSPVGLFTLALLDRDVDAFLRGAKAMDTRCQSPNLDENPAAQLAAVQWLLDTKRRLPVRVIMPYGHRLQSMGRWDQQLVAESLGKNEFHNPVPLAGYGTQDQHSLLQQWLAGPRISWHLFLREAEHPSLRVPDRIDPAFQWIAGQEFGSLLDACTEGTAQALTQCKRPHATLTLERLDETNLGEMFFLFMAEVVLLSKLYRIDPYGQPAVEIGKVITKELLTKPQA